MKFDDVFLMIEILLVVAVIMFFLTLVAFISGLIFLVKAREKLRRLSEPNIARDSAGRPLRERI